MLYTKVLSRYYERAEEGRLPTSLTHEDFNDENLEETSRYIALNKCHYIGEVIAFVSIQSFCRNDAEYLLVFFFIKNENIRFC